MDENLWTLWSISRGRFRLHNKLSIKFSVKNNRINCSCTMPETTLNLHWVHKLFLVLEKSIICEKVKFRICSTVPAVSCLPSRSMPASPASGPCSPPTGSPPSAGHGPRWRRLHPGAGERGSWRGAGARAAVGGADPPTGWRPVKT